jgi:hypothetical protein
MSVSRLRRTRSLGRARLRPWTLALLVALRWYALIAVLIAVYAFFHALR